MALLLEKTERGGVKFNYHRVSQYTVNRNESTTGVTLESYVDQAYREAHPEDGVPHSVALSGEPPTDGGALAWIYGQIKEQVPEWSEAENA